jgi:RNA polymerase sigma-70 factor (ECF subfamily)
MKNYHDGDYALNKFNDTSQYKLQIKLVDGTSHYYVSFIDGQDIHQETEVPRSVYQEFLEFVKTERSLRHWNERHREYSVLTDETLYNKAQQVPKSLEETVLDSIWKDHLQLILQKLPGTQRRRFIMYHEFGLTYEQIAEIEGCSHVSVSIAIKRVKAKIKESIKLFENQV